MVSQLLDTVTVSGYLGIFFMSFVFLKSLYWIPVILFVKYAVSSEVTCFFSFLFYSLTFRRIDVCWSFCQTLHKRGPRRKVCGSKYMVFLNHNDKLPYSFIPIKMDFLNHSKFSGDEESNTKGILLG